MFPGCLGGRDMATGETKSIRRVGLAQGCHTLLLHQRATSAQKEGRGDTSAQKEVQWANLAQKRVYNRPPPPSCPGIGDVEASM